MKNKIFKTIYFLLIILLLVSIFQTKKLPEKSEINEELYKEPIQTNTERDDFDFDYREKNYNVKPIADYELWGLVASVNNINAWYNYYHDENTVNLKDVCVIWGENINNEIYLDPKTKIKNGEWTCYYSWWSKDASKKIYSEQLSNNHLLSANEEIQKAIRNVNIGDQIHLKGLLVDYAEVGTSWYRKTSISRTDSNQSSRSGGACEIFYVEEINIVSENQKIWHTTKEWSLYIFFILLIIQFILFMHETTKSQNIFRKKQI